MHAETWSCAFLASHKDISKSKLAEQADDASGGKSNLGTGSSGSGEDPDEEDDDVESDAKRAVNQQYQRRRSRAVLYQLSGHYRKSVSMKGKLKLKNVNYCCFFFCKIEIFFLICFILLLRIFYILHRYPNIKRLVLRNHFLLSHIMVFSKPYGIG